VYNLKKMKFDYKNQLDDDFENDFEDIFKDFNFDLLEDKEFKEDAVREEIIFPLLKALEYSASSDNKVIRSKALKHPFYYFGTTKYNVNIIPDYTFQLNGENKWILDAKRPTENIDEGKNVFQAYSYAMHPEVQSEIYALCNGHKLTVFDVKKHIPILSFDIKNLKDNWISLKNILSPEFVIKPHLKHFHLDFGLFLFKISDLESKFLPIEFPLNKISDLAKLEEGSYCMNQSFGMKGFESQKFMGTFDFKEEQYQKLLKLVPENIKTEIEYSLTHQPFMVLKKKEEDLLEVNLKMKAIIGRKILTNNNESYLPFEITDFCE
jgi:hypothetical protein